MANRLFALLVGIDRYANPHQAPHLRGCVADVQGTYALLSGRFGVPESHIQMLTARLDQSEAPRDRATRANIVAGWQEHLAQAGPEDVVFFHYSGHGSQARGADPCEANGYDETLVPHDSRTPDIFDLTNKELAALIRSVEERGAQVLVFLDCCHTDGGTRHIWSSAAVRCCVADDRLRPPDSFLAGAAAFAPSRDRATPGGRLPLGSHVLLAACRENEPSYELCVSQAEPLAESRQWRGAASYFFHQALAAAGPEMTWAQIHDFVLTQVHALYPSQSPQLEGPVGLALWGSTHHPVNPYLLAMAVEGNEYVQVNGGAALGLTPGTRLAFFAPGVEPPGDPLAYGLVEEVQVDQAWAKLDRLAEIPVTARARVLALSFTTPLYRVQTNIPQIRQALVTGDRSPFLLPADEAAPQSDDASPADFPADFIVEVEDGLYLLRDGTGELSAELQLPATVEGSLQAVSMLEHIAVYRNIQRLHNPLGGALAAGLELEAVVYTQVGRAGRPLDPIPLHDRGHNALIDDGQKLLVTVHNRTDAPVYIAVLHLDPDYGISRVYPARTGYQLVQAQGSVVLEPLELRVAGLGHSRSREILKVIATRVPTSFDVLQLPKLTQGDGRAGPRADEESALGQLLNGVRRLGTRDLALATDENAAAWATRHLELTVMGRPAGRPLVAGATQVEAADGWVIEKPADFEGEWLVSNLELSTRGLDDPAALRLPPGLDNPEAREFFRPVLNGESTRSSGRAPVVVGLAAAGNHLASINPTRPLQIELPVDDEPGLAGIVPIAYDGKFFYLAGLPAPNAGRAATQPGRRRLTCEIYFLPQPVEAGDDPVSRDLKRTVRLYFYKLMDRGLPTGSGLRQVDLADGRVVYRSVSADEVSRARRVALMIHGFSSDTRRLVESVWSWVQVQGGYDLCLTFDYDALGTSIRRSAYLLANALQQVGIGPDDGLTLDLYTHSAGSQVGRALVELLDGAGYVDRLLMAGPPNAGTPLARGRALLPWLGNILFNLAGSVSPALMAHWLLERFTATAQGLGDLEPGSRFLEELNAPWRAPADVPYFIQIGDSSHTFPQGKELARRLMQGMDLGLDPLFASDNDLIVGADSARALETRRPRLEIAQLGVHHFQYFDSEEGRRALVRWLS